MGSLVELTVWLDGQPVFDKSCNDVQNLARECHDKMPNLTSLLIHMCTKGHFPFFEASDLVFFPAAPTALWEELCREASKVCPGLKVSFAF